MNKKLLKNNRLKIEGTLEINYNPEKQEWTTFFNCFPLFDQNKHLHDQQMNYNMRSLLGLEKKFPIPDLSRLFYNTLIVKKPSMLGEPYFYVTLRCVRCGEVFFAGDVREEPNKIPDDAKPICSSCAKEVQNIHALKLELKQKKVRWIQSSPH